MQHRAILLTCFLLISPTARADLIDDCLSLDPRTNPEAAVDACSKATLSESDSITQSRMLEQLGMAQRELGLVEEARTNLEAALQLTPDAASLWHQLGWTDRLLNDYPAAERHLRTAIALDASWPANLSLCVVLQDQAKFFESLAPCRAALNVAGANEDTSFFTARAYRLTANPKDALAVADQGLTLADPGPRLYLEAANAAFNLGDRPTSLGYIKDGLDRYPLEPSLLKVLVKVPMFDN